MSKVNNVLWTGGWDSTFRVIQLYRLGGVIQPIYVDDQNRKSKEKELATINKLIVEIPERFNKANGRILPLIIKERKNITSNLYLKLLYKILRKRLALGKQYYWLSCLSQEYENLELSIHKEDMDRFFYTEQLIRFNDKKLGTNWKINPKKVDFCKKNIFANMTFPIITISKPEMKQVSEKYDFLDLMESTWFCHRSNSKPCGKCTPCLQYVRDGFSYRIN